MTCKFPDTLICSLLDVFSVSFLAIKLPTKGSTLPMIKTLTMLMIMMFQFEKTCGFSLFIRSQYF